jgi:hypothetical protein
MRSGLFNVNTLQISEWKQAREPNLTRKKKKKTKSKDRETNYSLCVDIKLSLFCDVSEQENQHKVHTYLNKS